MADQPNVPRCNAQMSDSDEMFERLKVAMRSIDLNDIDAERQLQNIRSVILYATFLSLTKRTELNLLAYVLSNSIRGTKNGSSTNI